MGVSSMRDHAGQHKLYFIADNFGRQGIPVTVLLPDLEENRAYFEDKPHVRTHFYASGVALRDAWRKTQFVWEGNWSCVWVVGVGLRSYLLRRRSARRTPIVKDFDEFPSMLENISLFRRTYLKFIESRMIAQADGFTCASSFLEQFVRRIRPKLRDRILRLPVAISGNEHRVDPDMVQRLRNESKGRPILLYVGSVNRMYEDQLDEIIGLATVLRRRNSQAIVRVAGAGPDMEYFRTKAIAAHLGDTLEFIGHVDRGIALASHMEAAQVLLFPFAADPFNLSRCPTKAFHYAAANKPVVTNRTGEVANLFQDKALYYPERSVEAFANVCEEAIALGVRYNNGIPFERLTWESRAKQFMNWLDAQNWLPASVNISHAT
jgi:glycosyltransferase involved in cell wall biosynthesis